MDRKLLYLLCGGVFVFLFLYVSSTQNDYESSSSPSSSSALVESQRQQDLQPCPPAPKCPPVPQCISIPCPPCPESPDEEDQDEDEDPHEIPAADSPPCHLIAKSRKYDTRCTVLSPENIRQFVVTGTGRSGTTAMFGALKNIGLSCGHERVGRSRDGGVGWPYAVYGLDPIIDKDRLGLSRDLRFRVVLHQVRYPLKSIASLQTIKYRTFQFVEFHTGVKFDQDPMRRAMEHWITWNRIVDQVQDVRYRLEETHPVDVCLMAGFTKERCLRHPPTTEFNLPNARDHSDYTWEDLERADPELAKQAMKMTLEYGYTLNRTESDVEKDRKKLLARQEELMEEFRRLHPDWDPKDEEERLRLMKEREVKNAERKKLEKEALRAAGKMEEAEEDDEEEDIPDDGEEDEDEEAEGANKVKKEVVAKEA